MNLVSLLVEVEYCRDYICQLVFDNGVSGEVDFSVFLDKGPVFEPLKDVEFFKKISIDGGTVCWPNGADIAPERIYEMVPAPISCVAEQSDAYHTNKDSEDKKGG